MIRILEKRITLLNLMFVLFIGLIFVTPALGATLGTPQIQAVETSQLRITPDGTLLENNQNSIMGSQRHAMQEALAKSSPNLAPSGTGQITGTITDPSGNPISGVTVWVWMSLSENSRTTVGGYITTNASGQYVVSGLSSGQYKLEIDPSDSNSSNDTDYLKEWYNNTYSYETANDVTVTDGLVTSGIDVNLGIGGNISGTVTNTSGQPLVEVEVTAYTDTYSYVTYGNTTEDGNYIIHGLPEGDYAVSFEASWLNHNENQNYVSEWYKDARKFADAQAITVAAKAKVTNINASLAVGAKISGVITDDAGNPVANASIDVYDELQNRTAYSYTDSTGYYSVNGLSDGNYKLQFRPSWDQNKTYSNQWYNNKTSALDANLVKIQNGQDVQAINTKLKPAGIISGSVKDSNGNALEGIYVRLWYNEGIYWTSSNATSTDVNGNYTIKGASAGKYTVEFDAGSANSKNGTYYASRWYQDKTYNSSDEPVEVKSGQETPNISTQLSLGGGISGYVKDESGNPISGSYIYFYNDKDTSNTASAKSDSNGFYSVNDLLVGNYTLNFNPTNKATNYIREWYNNQVSKDKSTVVSVTKGKNTNNINIELLEGGSVSGKITNPAGNGIYNILIFAYDKNHNYAGYAYTSLSGKYTLRGLAASPYKLNIVNNADQTGKDYESQWYNNKTTFSNADTITVTKAQNTGNINAKLNQAGIPGQVTGLKATLLGGNQIKLDWTSQNGASTYTVYRSTSAEGEFAALTSVDENTYTDTNLESGTSYWYKVSASNLGGEGPQSIAVNANAKTTSPLKSLTVTPSSLTLGRGETASIKVMATYTDKSTEDVTTKAEWNSSKPEFAEVQSNPETGVQVKGVAKGSAVITGTFGGRSVKINVKVTPAIDRIEVNPSPISIVKSKSQSLKVYAYYEDGTKADVTRLATLSTQDPLIATINKTSLKGAGPGETVLHASYNAKETSTTVFVTDAAQSLTVDNTKFSLEIGDTHEFKLTATYKNGKTDTVTTQAGWSSSKPDIAQVLNDGNTVLVKGLSKGTAVLKAMYGGKTVTVNVSVTPRIVGLDVTPTSVALVKGKSQTLKAAILYEDGTKADVTKAAVLITDEPDIATVKGVTIKGVANGTAQIEVSYGGYTKVLTVNVTEPAKTLIADQKTVPLNVDGTTQIVLTASYKTGDPQVVSALAMWNSSKPDVAQVLVEGDVVTIKALKAGRATIKATYGGKSVTISVKVS